MERYIVKIKLLTPMLGTVPKNKEIYKNYIETKKPNEINEEESETIEEIEEKSWTGFHKDEKGLFIYDYLVRGFIRNAGNVLKEYLDVSNFRAKITDFLFVFPRRIYLGQVEPDGVLERPLRIITDKGPRSALVRSDYFDEGKEIQFEIGIIKNPKFSIEDVTKLFDYGQYQGLGQWRNGGYGRFTVISIEEKK